MPELRERSSKMKQISPSENQIAKRLNETGNIAAKNPSAFWLSNRKIAEAIGVIPVDVLPKAEQA